MACIQNKNDENTKLDKASISYLAINDFESVEADNFVPFYKDEDRGVIGIDAAIFKDEFSVARINFDGESGIYDLTFISMTEIDGESTYRILIDKKLIGTIQNPETDNDFELIPHLFEKIQIYNGQTIQIEFNSHSNGKIPEDGAFAYARGRWKGIELVKIE